MKIINLLLCLMISTLAWGKTSKKSALFLGNSYTFFNDLPKMVADVAASVGDTLEFDSNAPGGWTLNLHSTDATSTGKIALGKWDYVVLQEQSQMPSFPISQVEKDVFPYAKRLDSLVNVYNACAETIFYMTWGRKNGDAMNCPTYPPVCTYVGMDDLLQLRYGMMADSNDAILSPVAAVWRRLITTVPGLELYSPDEGHPSVAGSYAAACCFYATIFRKDPNLITFNSSLSPTDAAAIRAAAKLIVYDNLKDWNIGLFDPKANFTFTTTSNTVGFSNTSENATDYNWDFGDGKGATTASPSHTYVSKGTYTVKLIVTKCGLSDTMTKTVTINSTNIQNKLAEKEWTLFPNPAQSSINIKTPLVGTINYRIINSIGSLISEGNISEQQKDIDLSKFSKGMYLIQLYDGDMSLGQQKFLKE